MREELLSQCPRFHYELAALQELSGTSPEVFQEVLRRLPDVLQSFGLAVVRLRDAPVHD